MRFFVLSRPEPKSHWDTEYRPVENARYGDATRCASCGGFTSPRRWLQPYEVELKSHGRTFGDFAFRAAAQFLVSRHAAQSWVDAGLVGIREFHSVTVVSQTPRSIPRPEYRFPILELGATKIDARHTVIAPSESNTEICDVCLSRPIDAIGEVVVDIATWDGADLFIARGLPATVIVTERFASFVATSELTGVAVTPAEQFRWDPLRLLPR